jgi:hypothetical protein
MSKKSRRRQEIGGLFTYLDRRDRSGETVTPLDKLAEKIDFEAFRSVLEELVPSKVSDQGGRPPFDVVFMFKVLVLQHYYGLSDERVEFEILDRTSFQRFLGIVAEGRIPDRTTVWNFKERLGEAGAKRLFDFFSRAAGGGRSHRDEGPHRRCLLHRRAPAAQLSGGEPPHQGGRGRARRVVRGQEAPEGRGRPLDEKETTRRTTATRTM